MRLWDTSTVTQKTVVKPSLPKPGRVAVTTARFSRDGALILAGLANGSIQIWDHKGGAPSEAPFFACNHLTVVQPTAALLRSGC